MPTLSCKEVDLYYREQGHGEPLIMLHGFSVSHDYWFATGIVDVLAREYRVIALDLHGHGATTVSDHSRFNVDLMAEDLRIFVDRLGLSRFHLLGHSTGGMVAARFAMHHHERLISLVLNSTGSATVLGGGNPRTRRQALALFAELYVRLDWPDLFRHLKRTPGPLLHHLNNYSDRERLWGLLETLSRQNNGAMLADFLRRFFDDDDPQLTCLNKISCPTQVLIGSEDSLFMDAAHLLAREIPDVCLDIVHGVGHMMAIEAPDENQRYLLDFLRRRRCL